MDEISTPLATAPLREDSLPMRSALSRPSEPARTGISRSQNISSLVSYRNDSVVISCLDAQQTVSDRSFASLLL